MTPQVNKPAAPKGCRLIATAEPNNTIARRLEVYEQPNGRAYIIKQLPTNKWIAWASPDRDADQWIWLNDGTRQLWRWNYK